MPQGPFGNWKIDFFTFQALCPVVVPTGAFLGAGNLTFWIFETPLSGCRAHSGLLGAGNLTFWIFETPLSGCRARRGLLGAGNLTFLIVQPITHPYSP